MADSLQTVQALIAQAQSIIDSLTGSNLAFKDGTLQTNLNADLLDGNHAAAFATPSSVDTQINNRGYQTATDVQNKINAGNFAVRDGSLQANLNADLLDGNHAAAFATPASVDTQIAGKGYQTATDVQNKINAGNFAVKDGTLQSNLNADLLDGNHSSAFATPASVDTQVAGKNFAVKDGTVQSNLNADLLDGVHRGDGGAANYIPWFNASEKMFVRGSGKSVLQIGNQNALSVCDPYANISWAFNAYSDNANAMHYISTSTYGARGLTMNYASSDLLYWNIAPGTSTTADATFTKTDYRIWGEHNFSLAGTWTPTFAGMVTVGAFVYDTTLTFGYYVKLGRMCFVSFTMKITGMTTAPSGGARIMGLPFASQSYGTMDISNVSGWVNMPADAYISLNASYVGLRRGASVVSSTTDMPTGNPFTTAVTINGSACYQVA